MDSRKTIKGRPRKKGQLPAAKRKESDKVSRMRGMPKPG